jgi:shikimate dehydrogenase
VRIDGHTRIVGLIGQPIGHTLSPRLQNHALTALGENLAYLPFPLALEDLADWIRIFPRVGGVGLNVTTPYKQEVAKLVRGGDPEVVLTGVVNTVVYREGKPIGFNTDGRGFVAWMKRIRLRPASGGVALLGFGATARSLAYCLGQAYPLTVVTRRPPEAEATLQHWYGRGWTGLPSRVVSWSDTIPQQPVLAVGGLPAEAARSREVATWLGALDPTSTVVDLNYGTGRTPLADQARDRGLSAHDGVGLLVHQGALSLALWLERDVDPSLVEAGLRAQSP